MFFKELHHALPGILRCWRVVIVFLVVEEGVLCAWVEFDVVRDIVVIQYCVELLPVRRGEVPGGVRADNRTKTGNRLERTRVRAVIRGNDFKPIISAGPGDYKSAAHTETYCAKPSTINTWLFSKEGQG